MLCYLQEEEEEEKQKQEEEEEEEEEKVWKNMRGRLPASNYLTYFSKQQY